MTKADRTEREESEVSRSGALGDGAINSSISRATLRMEHLLPNFMTYLGGVDRKAAERIADNFADMGWPADSDDDLKFPDPFGEDELELVDYLFEELVTALDSIAPKGCFFGTHPGDGSDFGFWEYGDDALDDDAETLAELVGMLSATGSTGLTPKEYQREADLYNYKREYEIYNEKDEADGSVLHTVAEVGAYGIGYGQGYDDGRDSIRFSAVERAKDDNVWYDAGYNNGRDEANEKAQGLVNLAYLRGMAAGRDVGYYEGYTKAERASRQEAILAIDAAYKDGKADGLAHSWDAMAERVKYEVGYGLERLANKE